MKKDIIKKYSDNTTGNKMNKIYSVFLFAILMIILGSSAYAAVGVGSWVANNNVVLNISNGQTAEFRYGVTAITSKNGEYSINLYRDGTSAPIRTYVGYQPTVGNGAQGRFNVTPADYNSVTGNYYIIITSVDGFGTDYFRMNLVVNPTVILITPFSVSCISAPTTGYAPLNVALSAAVTGTSIYSYAWSFDDTSYNVTTSNNINHIYDAGTFNPIVNVTDTNSGLSVAASCGAINVLPPVLTIQSINCFSRVIDGYNQSCSVDVTSNNGAIAGNVNVNVYYIDGSLFGTCVTNRLSGKCAVTASVNGIGTDTVYATANAPGYTGDNMGSLQYTFDVYTQKYNIINLAIYNDSNYFYPSSVFYRGQPLYVKFQVYNPSSNQFVGNDIVTAATLVSLAGGRADLSRVSYINNWYYYKLDAIPLTHEFMGNSNVFTFAFNFSSVSGGEAQASLTILNNNPTISNIADVYVNVGQTKYLDLNDYGRDLEDSTLQWSIINNPNIAISNILTGNILSIKGNSVGDGTLTLRAYDLDNDYADAILNVHVAQNITTNNTNTTTNTTLSVACTAMPSSGTIPLGVALSSTVSGGTGPYTYIYTYGNGAITVGVNPGFDTYTAPGIYAPSVRVIDSVGSTGSASCGLIIASNSTGNNTINGVITGGPYTGYINEPVTFDASQTHGCITSYGWNFGDGTSSTEQHPIHAYQKAGQFVVVLNIEGPAGSSRRSKIWDVVVR